MSTLNISVTLSDPFIHQAEMYGLLRPEAIAGLLQEAVYTLHRESHDKTPILKESFEEFCARYDQIKISTSDWKFDRAELYGGRQ